MEDFFASNIKIKSVGVNINQQARIVINNVFTFLNELKEDPEKLKEINFNQTRALTAKICGVSIRTVDKIKKECTDGEPCFPREHIPRPVTELDKFDKSVIKQIISSYSEYPSVKKIVEKAKERIEGFHCSQSSMRIILSELGYKYKLTPDGRKLMERRDIVCARLKFLKKLKELKDSKDTRPRIYLDETWIYQNHSRKRGFPDENNGGSLNKNTCKESRLIVCHAGCAKYGFVRNEVWIYRPVKSKNEEYNSEVKTKRFTEWFEQLILSLEESCVIIMDNASYHSQQINNTPTSASTIDEIQKWHKDNEVIYSDADLKKELLEKVHRHKPEKSYFLDQLANEHGHEVVRLPLYNSQYNAMELVWAQVKEDMAAKSSNITADVENILHKAIANVSTEDWVKCVQHTEDLQDEDLKNIPEPFVNNSNDNSDDDDSEVR